MCPAILGESLSCTKAIFRMPHLTAVLLPYQKSHVGWLLRAYSTYNSACRCCNFEAYIYLVPR